MWVLGLCGVRRVGNILCSRRHAGDKVIVEVLIDQDEFRQLRGELDDVYLFSENVVKTPSKVSLRGRNHATQYFLIPRKLRKDLSIGGEVSCQRLESEDGKSIFVYVLDPYKEGRSSKIAES